MSIIDSLRRLTGEISAQLKDSDTLLRRVGMLPPETYLEENFRNHGSAFGCNNLAEFTALAHKFYKDANDNKSTDMSYSFVDGGYGRIVIDHNGEMRGIFTTDGKPLAFFCPDFRQLGYNSKQEELDEFRRGSAYKQTKVYPLAKKKKYSITSGKDSL